MKRLRTRQPAMIGGPRGFTLVEMMVALAILSIASIFIYTVFVTQQRAYIAEEDIAETQQDVRASLDLLTRDLRSAGFGVAGGGTPITVTVNSNPDSITFRAAQGAATYFTATPTTTTVAVGSTASFSVGDSVAALSTWDKTALGNYTVALIGSGTQMTLSGTPALARTGDFVTGPVGDITYSVVNGALIRTTGGVGETLADQIADLQFSYTLSTGATVDDPDASPNGLTTIRSVLVTLTTQTERDAADLGSGAARTRQLSSVIRLKNCVNGGAGLC